MLLSEKEMDVINLFLSKEEGFTINPAKIAREAHGRVTRAWTGKVCDRLERNGLLASVPIKPRNKRQPTKHYRLRPGGDAFKTLARRYFYTLARHWGPEWPKMAHTVLASRHARAQLTPDFVREVLAARNVQMRYAVTPEGRPYPEISVAEQLATSRRDGPRPFLLCFPVAPPHATPGDVAAGVREFADRVPKLAPEILRRLVDHHYREIEDKTLVFPILALLEVSPNAILEFVGDWEPYVLRSMGSFDSGIGMVEHVLFRLVFASVADLSMTCDVPRLSDVTFATVHPEHPLFGDSSSHFLQLIWRNEKVIRYDAGFDTEHTYVGDDEDVIEYMRNPENGWVRISWADAPRLAPPDTTDGEVLAP